MEHTDASGWGNEATARAYAAYARAYPMYRETARDLVAIAQVAPGAVVIDLACGTGVVTEELLGRVGVAGHVTGVDSSRAMLDIARGQIRAHNVRFVQAPAEQLPTLVASQVDIVVCNSAFWQLPLAETLHAIAAVLASRGRFTFNLPWRFFRPVAKEDTPVAPPRCSNSWWKLPSTTTGTGRPQGRHGARWTWHNSGRLSPPAASGLRPRRRSPIAINNRRQSRSRSCASQ